MCFLSGHLLKLIYNLSFFTLVQAPSTTVSKYPVQTTGGIISSSVSAHIPITKLGKCPQGPNAFLFFERLAIQCNLSSKLFMSLEINSAMF